MGNLKHTAYYIDKLNTYLGHGFAWLSLFMVLVMFVVVICRYLFNFSIAWLQELAIFMHAMLFLSVAGYTLLKDKHVRVDILYHKFSDKQRAWVALIGGNLFLLPLAVAIIYFSDGFIINSWKILEQSPEYQGMQGVFILKSFIWVYAFSLIMQNISISCKSIITLRESS